MITFLKQFRTELGKLCEQAKKLQDSFQTYDPITNSWLEESLKELITSITDIQHKNIEFYNETLFLLPSPQEEDSESYLKENLKTKDKESSHSRRKSLSDYWAILFPKIKLKDKKVKEENSPEIQSNVSASGKQEEDEESSEKTKVEADSSSEQNKMLRQRSMTF